MKNQRQIKVLFMVPYPLRHAPSQRFRVELYEQFMTDAGIWFSYASFMDEKTWNILYKGGGGIQKSAGILKGYLKRLKTVLYNAKDYDYIFIHREAAPLGPPVIEFILSKLFGSRIIYDFDDAIWIPNTTAENKIASWFKAVWKVKYICQWAYKISAGNNYLLDYARKYNSNSFLIPTCIDAVNAHNRLKQHQNSEVVIGWTGSHSTLTYLDEILPVIERLSREYSFIFMVIANKDPRLQLSNYRFKPWKEETEVEDLLSFDIGVMPLSPDPWSEGKCGFKLIQYLALGIPAVASPVGVNKDIIKEGNNGFLATTPDEWYIHLSKLLTDLELRKTMGHRGRQLVVENYSVQAYRNRFLQLFS